MNYLPYKPEIISAFNAWNKAENEVPEKEYDIKYKAKSATAKRHWRKFSDLCKANDLHPVKVAHSLRGTTKLYTSI